MDVSLGLRPWGGLDSDTTTGIAHPFLALAEPEDAKRKHPASALL